MTAEEGSADPLARLDRERLTRHARMDFYERLERLELELIAAAGQPAGAIQGVTEAFLDGDAPTAETWVSQNVGLARSCRSLEEEGYVFLARQGPVASDLRRVVAILRGADDVRRSGSLLAHIATSLTWVDPRGLSKSIRDIVRELGEVVGSIFVGAVQAWREADGLAAIDLQHEDDRADGLQKQLLGELYGGGCSVEEAVSLALMARYYERIADHGVDLARGVTWAVTGDRLPDA
jgi:phosphate transport system protein